MDPEIAGILRVLDLSISFKLNKNTRIIFFPNFPHTILNKSLIMQMSNCNTFVSNKT